MAIQEKLTYDEQSFVEGMLNPLTFFEMFMPAVDSSVAKARDYQVDMLLNGSNCTVAKAGRGVGKTTVLASDILKVMHENPRKQGLLTTPNKAHIEPLWNRLTNFIKSDQYWNSFVVRMVKSDTYTMECSNGYILHGRISGTSKGTGLLSLHVDHAWIDEAQLYLGIGLDQLQGVLKQGCRIRIYGVPNGMRKGYLSIAYDDPKIPDSSKYKITRWKDPTYTDEEDKRLQRIYGGKYSQSYLNQVLADDGVSTNKTFDPAYFSKCFVELPAYEIFEFDGKKVKEDEIKEEEVNIPELPAEAIEVHISADLGFHPDPSIVGIWYRIENRMSYLLCKFALYNITYTRQAKFFDAIANITGARTVSIDVGGPGQTVFLDLSNENKYPNKKYSILGVDFRSNVPIGATPQGEIIKANQKYHATTLMREMFQKQHIFLPGEDLDMYNELDSNTQFKSSKGIYTYVGVDHNIDMIRCFLLQDLLNAGVRRDMQGSVYGFSDF
jgi:hypothetical protein